MVRGIRDSLGLERSFNITKNNLSLTKAGVVKAFSDLIYTEYENAKVVSIEYLKSHGYTVKQDENLIKT